MTEDDVQLLATFNAEQARGIVHSREWIEKMIELQSRFDRSIYEDLQSAPSVFRGR